MADNHSLVFEVRGDGFIDSDGTIQHNVHIFYEVVTIFGLQLQ
jgi:hypothetical protein